MNSDNKKESENQGNILVVDDELSMREFLELLLMRQGYTVTCAGSGKEAVRCIEEDRFDLLLCDIRLGDMTGLDVLRALKKHQPNAGVIMISAYASTENAVEAMNEGAYDYVPKPFDVEELKLTIRNALALKTVASEKKVLDFNLEKNRHLGKFVGNSPGMTRIYELIRQVAQTRTNVLVTGESGTGKELIARAIHEQSGRKDAPFVVINCAGIPETLMESELFGHVKGSFTGATQDKKGLFEMADKGTVFLDEIGEISPQLQVKLLRVIQERVFKAVGGSRDIAVDIRIISATNKSLEEEVISGGFREDLFYRLNVIEIKVPPLRDRKEDLRPLAQHFLEKYSNEMGKKIAKISSYAIDLLTKYDFPGNIRELENLMERSVALSNTNIILPESLTLATHKKRWNEGGNPSATLDLAQVKDGISLDKILSEVEKSYLIRALEIAEGKKNKAAELLGISFPSLRHRLQKQNIDGPDK